MLCALEGLMGPYVWGRYDMLVLPPSFPYGGMENPCMTFVTPTLIVGWLLLGWAFEKQTHEICIFSLNFWNWNIFGMNLAVHSSNRPCGLTMYYKVTGKHNLYVNRLGTDRAQMWLLMRWHTAGLAIWWPTALGNTSGWLAMLTCYYNTRMWLYFLYIVCEAPELL
jgi:hypothetical protein